MFLIEHEMTENYSEKFDRLNDKEWKNEYNQNT
jgi:hypothetical protein